MSLRIKQYWICGSCGAKQGTENHLPHCEFLKQRKESLKNRLRPDSDIECNMELDWANNGKVCRDLIKNNPNAVREHMIKRHGWQEVPQLEQEHRIRKLYDKALTDFYEQNPKEWFFDNQLIYQEFRKQRFKNPLLIK